MDLQTTKEKIYRSSILTFISILAALVTILGAELTDFIETGDPISYKTALSVTVGTIIPWLLNTLKKVYDYVSSNDGETTPVDDDIPSSIVTQERALMKLTNSARKYHDYLTSSEEKKE